MIKIDKKKYDLPIISLIILIIISRIIPHPHNFTPIISFAIMGSWLFQNQMKTIILTFIIMVTSDLILGFYENIFYVYAALLFIILSFAKNKKYNYQNLILKGFLGSLIFFVLTNFCVWIFEDIYPKTLSGIFSCFIYAIPFFKNTLISTVMFNYIIFYIFKKKIENITKIIY
jgi:hypothetical protein